MKLSPLSFIGWLLVVLFSIAVIVGVSRGLAQSSQNLVLSQQTNCGAPTTDSVSPDATVDINDHSFTSPIVEIEVGQTVEWINKDDRSHRFVSAANGGKQCMTLMSPEIAADETFSFTFTQPGVWDYVDAGNSESGGQVVVK